VVGLEREVDRSPAVLGTMPGTVAELPYERRLRRDADG
jgi:hypothetical protein